MRTTLTLEKDVAARLEQVARKRRQPLKAVVNEALRLVERFSRPDLNTLRYEVTVDDPRTYTRPWRSEWTVRWVPDREIEEFFCEENAESTFIR